MCSCAEPVVSGRRWRLLALSSCLCWLLAACFIEHPCGQERCDGQDNDCDGRIDEDYTSDDGLYLDVEHCGACELRCDEVLPSAQRTACVRQDGRAQCAIAECPTGQRAVGGACVEDVGVACLPCTQDEECELREAGARCVADGLAGERCAPACGPEDACPEGYVCVAADDSRVCRPRSGACECTPQMLGARFACERSAEASLRSCPGWHTCTEAGLSACEPALAEACNQQDDDCDGQIDEDFVDAAGRYVSSQHCGACGMTCAAQGPHMIASCLPTFDGAMCQQTCEAGFVDRDAIANNGCECQRGSARVPLISADQDCDGEDDPIPELIFVSAGGDDANDGSAPDFAVRSITRGMELGALFERTVVVARGVYRERVSLLAGITVVGGYSPEFTAHDAELYPVWIEAPVSDPGLPVLTCDDVDQGTYVADLTIIGSDASDPGQGSTAVLLAGCTDAVELHGITVIARRGADGQRGADSSERLAQASGLNLADLAGVGGGVGSNSLGDSCSLVPGGNAGILSCDGADVSGGVGGAALCASLSCSNADSIPCGNAGCTDFTSDGVCDIEAARAAARSNPPAEPGQGRAPGQAGEPTYDAPTNHGACSFCDDNPSLPRSGSDGGDGAAGEAGMGGLGCEAAPTLDARGLLSGEPGSAGQDGADGSGGGGGSAGAGYAVIDATAGNCSSVPGAAGGGGGSGGCGAPGAAGGGGGGASVGIVIRLRARASSGPVLDSVRIVTASGGDAGAGGVGAAGGAGGSGGLGGISTFWCARNGGRGGDGGAGGAAGGGGGGCGGPSFGIYVAYDGQDLTPDGYVASLQQATRIEVAGSAGRAGLGGFSPSHPGAAGRAGSAVPIAFGKF